MNTTETKEKQKDVNAEQDAFKVCKDALLETIEKHKDSKDLIEAFGISEELFDKIYHKFGKVIPKTFFLEKKSDVYALILKTSDNLMEFVLGVMSYQHLRENLPDSIESAALLSMLRMGMKE